jgi:cell division septation protein DedD
MKQDPRHSNTVRLVSTTVVLTAAVALALVRAQAAPPAKGSASVTVSACKLAWVGPLALCEKESFDVVPGTKPSISTKGGGAASLKFPNATLVTVLQDSVFVIDSYAKDGVRGILKSGTIHYYSSVQKKSDEIEGKSTKIHHIGTSFLFSREPESAQSDAQQPSGKEVVREVDVKRAFKLSDLREWKQRIRQVCEDTCKPLAWKRNTYRVSVQLPTKLLKELSCGCVARTKADRDGDGVLDADDACPDQQGSVSESKALHGCPALVERVILLPDEDGNVGQLELQDLKTGQVVAKLEQAYTSAGVTSDGAVVTPVVKETPESIAAIAPAPEPTKPTPPPEPAIVATPVPSATQHCYWMSNAPPYPWKLRTDLNRRQCYEMDSCDGGRGMSGGGCYKWAAGADAPRQTWSELRCPDC